MIAGERRWPLGKYGLAIVLAALFLASWVVQTWTGWHHFEADQLAHGETARWTGPDGYWWDWGEATFENWQSEFLQLLTFVVLARYLIFKGSPQSRDGDDDMQETLDEIVVRIDYLTDRLGERLS